MDIETLKALALSRAKTFTLALTAKEKWELKIDNQQVTNTDLATVLKGGITILNKMPTSDNSIGDKILHAIDTNSAEDLQAQLKNLTSKSGGRLPRVSRLTGEDKTSVQIPSAKLRKALHAGALKAYGDVNLELVLMDYALSKRADAKVIETLLNHSKADGLVCYHSVSTSSSGQETPNLLIVTIRMLSRLNSEEVTPYVHLIVDRCKNQKEINEACQSRHPELAKRIVDQGKLTTYLKQQAWKAAMLKGNPQTAAVLEDSAGLGEQDVNLHAKILLNSPFTGILLSERGWDLDTAVKEARLSSNQTKLTKLEIYLKRRASNELSTLEVEEMSAELDLA